MLNGDFAEPETFLLEVSLMDEVSDESNFDVDTEEQELIGNNDDQS